MSTRSDSGVYVDLLSESGVEDALTRREWRQQLAWDTDHDAYQNGSNGPVKTDLPHNIVPIVANGSDESAFKELFAIRGPHFNNVSVYLKKIAPTLNQGGGVKGPPPIFKLEMRTGIPCLVDHWITATIQAATFEEGGLLWSGVFPIAQALEIYGGIVRGDDQPANSVVPIEVKLRIVVALSANDLGLAAFETPPANITNKLVVTLSP